MLRAMRQVRRTFNWDVVIRLALLPVVTYVLAGAAMGGGQRTGRATEAAIGMASWLAER